jgi:hypothetical protein
LKILENFIVNQSMVLCGISYMETNHN